MGKEDNAIVCNHTVLPSLYLHGEASDVVDRHEMYGHTK